MYICLRRQSVRFCTATAAAVALFFLSGCATKKYIARETDSLNQKIHEVDKNQQNTQKELDVSRASAVTTQQKLDRLNDELQTLKTQLEELRRGAKAAPDGRQPYAVVHVFYATDRKIDLRSASIEGIYGGDRSDNELLSFGTLDVS